jgi:hypothetical protein
METIKFVPKVKTTLSRTISLKSKYRFIRISVKNKELKLAPIIPNLKIYNETFEKPKFSPIIELKSNPMKAAES